MSFGAVLGVGSLVLGASSASKQAKAQKAAGAAAAELGEANAQQAIAQAEDLERIRRDEILKALGTQRASYAASGVSVEEGSPLLVMAESLDRGMEDIKAIREQGDLAAYAARLGGGYAQQQANSLAKATKIQGVSSFLSGAYDLGRATGLIKVNPGVAIA